MTDPTPMDHEEPMRIFNSVATSTSSDFLQNVLRTSMCPEKADKGNMKEAVSNFERQSLLLEDGWRDRKLLVKMASQTSFMEVL